ncbi:putative ribosome-binding factor A, mitochondrial isoform X2 [Macaca mulatta]|uniref:putative ribosome-binding factor A, mitochondrial isoform X2 n=1 Tax=Macaca mulatta TaxID=9544 RepID=UPI0003ABA622|nr:PREDICTED: putative ribosome-binding factor A, mitochondrial isoform X2 [Macaca fascicularis]XP_028693740.1 putative ribosome-binding factor A, mitochondrial isoform X2 [Macaca mulatta]
MWAVAGGLWGSRAGLRGLLRSRDAALLPGCARGVHGSAVFCKNWLKKFASKTKKKFWYEGPSLGSHLTYKPSKLEFLMKTTSKKTRKEDHVRVRALNGLLYKALTDLLCTPEVSQELYDLNVELSKVSLTPDFSACRVYWKTTLSAEQNAHMEAVLQRSAASMSLTSYWQSQTLDPGMKETTLYKMISGTPMPRNPVAPQSRPRAPACVVSIMRRSTSRLWSTKGGKIKGSGAWCGRGMRLS